MDERQIVDSIGKLAGVVTALEMQVQAVLLAAVKAGMEPDDVLQACMGLSVSSARHCRSALVIGPAVRPCLGGCVTIGGELALRGAGHRAANLYAVDPPGAKP